ncbi:uncharacterized protein LOC112520428 [Cynara cardunculus var. scolymus]|uniref:uncharacterized protein LOC112520428 n=1 Tax=Cynara cardunculus var. scolymus TaxID=59895 RepID=UPI000D628B5E|nr:uncharacterized protein LOC112520428 [Cynara cardunculus var. scolymus]
MTDQQLTLQDEHGRTALHIAAAVGNVDMAMAMVGKHPQLLKIRNGVNALPIYVAVIYGKHDMVAYLYDEYKSMAGYNWTVDDISNVLWRCIEADLFDCAIRILDDQGDLFGFPSRVYAREILYILAQKTYVFKCIKLWKNSNVRYLQSLGCDLP